MRYYDCGGYPLCSREVLALPALHALPEAGEVLFGFHRTPGAGRDTFPVTAPSLLTAEEGVSTLVTAEEPETDPALAAAIAAGRVRALNLAHPRQEELLPPLRRRERVRVNLLALGDVGSTLLMGLRLLGGDVIDSVGICDVRENVPQRWEMELNQIVFPEGEELPPVEIVSPEEVFDGDVFLFCASRFVPDTSVTSGDARMAQYQVNRELASAMPAWPGSGATEGCSAWSAIRWIPCAGRCWRRATGTRRAGGTAEGCFPIRCGASDWGSCRPEPCTMPGRSHGLPLF